MSLDTNRQPQLEIVVRRAQRSGRCQYAVAFTRGYHHEGNYDRFLAQSRDHLAFQIWNNSLTEILKDLPEAVPPASVIFNNFSSSDEANTKREFYRVNLDSPAFHLRSGPYENSFQVKLYTRPLEGGAWYTADTRVQVFRFQNPSQVDTCVVDPGAPFTPGDSFQAINFGTLQKHKSRAFDLIVRNNNRFKFSITSQNNGQLQRVGGKNRPQDRIRYRMSIGATSVNPVTEIWHFPYHSPAFAPPVGSETRFPFTVEITEDVDQARAGTYTDQATINFTAL